MRPIPKLSNRQTNPPAPESAGAAVAEPDTPRERARFDVPAVPRNPGQILPDEPADLKQAVAVRERLRDEVNAGPRSEAGARYHNSECEYQVEQAREAITRENSFGLKITPERRANLESIIARKTAERVEYSPAARRDFIVSTIAGALKWADARYDVASEELGALRQFCADNRIQPHMLGGDRPQRYQMLVGEQIDIDRFRRDLREIVTEELPRLLPEQFAAALERFTTAHRLLSELVGLGINGADYAGPRDRIGDRLRAANAAVRTATWVDLEGFDFSAGE